MDGYWKEKPDGTMGSPKYWWKENASIDRPSWQQGKSWDPAAIGENRDQWGSAFDQKIGNLWDSYKDYGAFKSGGWTLPGAWAGQWAYESAAPGIQYGLPQAYENLAGLLSMGGGISPAGANLQIQQLGQQGMMDQQGLQADMAESGMSGSQLGQAQLGAMGAGTAGAQANVYSDYMNRQEAQQRDDLARAYQMAMSFPMGLWGQAANMQGGVWNQQMLRGDRDMQQYAAIMNALGGVANADWSGFSDLWKKEPGKGESAGGGFGTDVTI